MQLAPLNHREAAGVANGCFLVRALRPPIEASIETPSDGACRGVMAAA
jgi:hypothetical protein